MNKVIIFDLDGTLLDSQNGILFSLEYVLNKYAKEYLPFLDRTLIGPPIKTILEGFISDPKSVSLLSKRFRLHYDSCGFLKTHLFQGVYGGLTEISSFSLYISTNKPEKVTKKILSRLEIDSFFNDIVCIDSASYRDKTEIVKSIIKHHSNHKIIVVGDSEDDYYSALHNNCNFLYCSYGYGDLSVENQNIKSINSVKELFSTILAS